MGWFQNDMLLAEFDSTNREDYAPLVAWRETLPKEWAALIVGPVDAIANSMVWFAMLPDGSKEGWDDSNKGDEIRARFIELCGRGIELWASYGDGGRVIRGVDDDDYDD